MARAPARNGTAGRGRRRVRRRQAKERAETVAPSTASLQKFQPREVLAGVRTKIELGRRLADAEAQGAHFAVGLR